MKSDRNDPLAGGASEPQPLRTAIYRATSDVARQVPPPPAGEINVDARELLELLERRKKSGRDRIDDLMSSLGRESTENVRREILSFRATMKNAAQQIVAFAGREPATMASLGELLRRLQHLSDELERLRAGNVLAPSTDLDFKLIRGAFAELLLSLGTHQKRLAERLMNEKLAQGALPENKEAELCARVEHYVASIASICTGIRLFGSLAERQRE